MNPTKKSKESAAGNELSVKNEPETDDEVTENVVCEVDENLFGPDDADNDDDDNEGDGDANEQAADGKKETIRCELCTTTTLTKSSMRRHCLRSHDLVTTRFANVHNFSKLN